MFGLFKRNQIELEFRKYNGSHMFTLKGEAAQRIHRNLCSIPELKKGTKDLKTKNTDEFKEFIVFDCIKKCGYVFWGHLEVALQPGDYIKIIQ